MFLHSGEGSLRYAIVFGGLVPKSGNPSPATLALHLAAVTSPRAVTAAAAAAAARSDSPEARGSTPVAAVPAGAAVGATVSKEEGPRRRRASKEGGPEGGRGPSPQPSGRAASEEDDSAGRSWQALSFAPGEAPAARCAHAAVAWGPHRMLVHGGEGETPLGGRPPLLADVHALLVSRGAAPDGRGARWRWAALHCGGTPPSPRRHHALAAVDERVAFLYGGELESGRASAELFVLVDLDHDLDLEADLPKGGKPANDEYDMNDEQREMMRGLEEARLAKEEVERQGRAAEARTRQSNTPPRLVWSCLSTAGGAPPPLRRHSLLPAGPASLVLLGGAAAHGGVGRYNCGVYLFDTQAFTWSRLPFCDGVPPSVWSATTTGAEPPGAPREHHAAAAVPLQSHGALVSVVHGGEGPVEGGGQLLPRSGAHPGCLSVLSGRWLDTTPPAVAAAGASSPRAAAEYEPPRLTLTLTLTLTLSLTLTLTLTLTLGTSLLGCRAPSRAHMCQRVRPAVTSDGWAQSGPPRRRPMARRGARSRATRWAATSCGSSNARAPLLGLWFKVRV